VIAIGVWGGVAVVNDPATGSITIVENAVGGDGPFPFITDIPDAPPNLVLSTHAGTATTTFNNVAAGTYTVTEGQTVGFSFTKTTPRPMAPP